MECRQKTCDARYKRVDKERVRRAKQFAMAAIIPQVSLLENRCDRIEEAKYDHRPEVMICARL